MPAANMAALAAVCAAAAGQQQVKARPQSPPRRLSLESRMRPPGAAPLHSKGRGLFAQPRRREGPACGRRAVRLRERPVVGGAVRRPCSPPGQLGPRAAVLCRARSLTVLLVCRAGSKIVGSQVERVVWQSLAIER